MPSGNQTSHAFHALSHTSHAFEHLYKEKEGRHVGINQAIMESNDQFRRKIHQEIKLAHSESLSLKMEIKDSTGSFADIRCHPYD